MERRTTDQRDVIPQATKPADGQFSGDAQELQSAGVGMSTDIQVGKIPAQRIDSDIIFDRMPLDDAASFAVDMRGNVAR